MSLHSFEFLINSFQLNLKKSKTSGFTLTELLVSLIMAGIIISSTLSLVINLLDTDRQESASNATQSEMQMALNYIASDLKEAVYVYDDAAKIKDYIPNFDTSIKPILAFWKPEAIDPDGSASLKPPADCTGFTDNTTTKVFKKTECDILLLRRNTYTLVVYLQAKNPANDDKWKGKSRIIRYQLRKYSDMANLTKTTGYIDPVQDKTNFKIWPKDSADNNLQSTTRPAVDTNDVLVDFVDDPDNGNIPDCPDNTKYNCYGTTPNPPSKSFFTYVRKEENQFGFNQDTFIFLRGNPVGRPGIFSNNQFLPTLQTQVLVNGVIDKVPNQ
ncbi:prepilin-type N-terminal cleavage/methylation domain-containing protein [Chroococcidiopsis thermalis]|uniref:Prepilin-type N-terminal cleavage/methylation domain-containing protein n=1 Tax=Chroococcidiopsis thermalis (strain PCC 7203) TaxID=251229 RepID=K9TW99_CHRTP|nr:prepilin-type N-terminal cleavage/methylation domain-containing protein [Chroococcidiopsis thermalis]AFY86678.1 hypothetical protein Chro_1149 [Chroococcidiopsis thermalis PCC 7203]